MKKNSAALLLAFWISNVPAVDGVSLEIGRGTRELNLARVGAQWDGSARWHDVAHYWDLSFGGWSNGHGTVWDLGLTPVFHLEKPDGGTYLEAAIGFHVLSDLDVGTGADLSTRFQFGDHVGLGTRLGGYDWSVRLQHLSNGGLRNPNPGINFVVLRLQYRVH